ncbi:MAG: high-potential iron-sulfur protein [Burkholderiaceae bacterium]
MNFPFPCTSRRTFLKYAAGATSWLAGTATLAQIMGPRVDEKEPIAMAMGYLTDIARADQKKFPEHMADQKCTPCIFFAGKATDAAGNCPLFAGKQVAGPGWCCAWVKKAA